MPNSISFSRTLLTTLSATLSLAACTARPAGDSPRETTAALTTAAPATATFPTCHYVPSANASVPSFVVDQGSWVATYAPVSGYGNGGDSVSNKGGAVVTTASLQLIFWGSLWTGATNPSTSDVVGGIERILSSTYLAEMSQYGYRSLAIRGVTYDTSDPAPYFQESDIQKRLWYLIETNHWPTTADGEHVIYVLLMPPKTQFGGGNFTGAHEDFLQPVPPWSFAWGAWIGHDTLDGMMRAFTHELVETLSDPQPNEGNAWVMDRVFPGGPNEDEIGDACNVTADCLNGVIVQSYWSEAQHACVIPYPSPPTLTGLSPTSGAATGGTLVAIDGTGFDTAGNTYVTFSGTPALNVSCASTTQCLATAPPGVDTVDVHVTVNYFSTASDAASKFHYAPAVTSVLPASGRVGDRVTVYGAGFDTHAGATTISFGGRAATGVACDATSCVATVPPGAGTVDVQVTAFGLPSSKSPSDHFAYETPIVTSLSPSAGPVTGGTVVDIYGAGFDPDAATDGSTTVSFGDATTSRVWCPLATWCRAFTPSHGAGTFPVSITVFGASSTGGPTFTFDAFPRLTAFSWTASGWYLSLDGDAPPGDAVVTITSSDPSVVPDSTVRIPAGSSSTVFLISVLPTATSEAVTLTASYEGSSLTTTLDVTAQPPLRLDLGTPDGTLAPGESSTATVTINAPAPRDGTPVLLTSSSAGLSIPSGVTIPGGRFSKTFVVTNARRSTLPLRVTVTATAGSASASDDVLLGKPHIVPPNR